jgi:DNA invertase Pin-like site-specific DNA recombinase
MTTPAIQPHHRERLAVFYGRQSTPDQVESNVGSADYQRHQTRYAREWGWVEANIRWHDDFGRTGAAAEHRPQYREMRRLLKEGQVGLIGVADLSRLGRDAAELLSFRSDCIAHDVLVAVDGQIINLHDLVEWLPAIFETMEQELRTKRMRELSLRSARARAARLKQHELRARGPEREKLK